MDKEFVVVVTGYILELTDKIVSIQWHGGSRLEVPKSHAGGLGSLPIGQWFRAFVVLGASGEVKSGVLTKIIEEPKPYSTDELLENYCSIPAAKLEPVE